LRILGRQMMVATVLDTLSRRRTAVQCARGPQQRLALPNLLVITSAILH
jgi:hypothetical protein